jgi:hypothetical protein
MDRVVDAEIKKTGDKEVRARVVNPAGNLGEATSKKGDEEEAVKAALKEADKKGTEKDVE